MHELAVAINSLGKIEPKQGIMGHACRVVKNRSTYVESDGLLAPAKETISEVKKPGDAASCSKSQ